MTTENNNNSIETTPHRNGGLVAGSILIIIGLLSIIGLLFPQFNLGTAFMPILGILFLAWGLIVRKAGLLIPGGIILGIGVGAMLVEGPLAATSDETMGGIVLLSFAAGWALITLLTALFVRPTMWWPLIPGGVMAAIGAMLVLGDFSEPLLQVLNYIWPVVLICVGLFIILRRRDSN